MSADRPLITAPWPVLRRLWQPPDAKTEMDWVVRLDLRYPRRARRDERARRRANPRPWCRALSLMTLWLGWSATAGYILRLARLTAVDATADMPKGAVQIVGG